MDDFMSKVLVSAGDGIWFGTIEKISGRNLNIVYLRDARFLLIDSFAIDLSRVANDGVYSRRIKACPTVKMVRVTVDEIILITDEAAKSIESARDADPAPDFDKKDEEVSEMQEIRDRYNALNSKNTRNCIIFVCLMATATISNLLILLAK